MATNNFDAVYKTAFGKLDEQLQQMTASAVIKGNSFAGKFAGRARTATIENVKEGVVSDNVYGADNSIQTFTAQSDTMVLDSTPEYSFTMDDYNRNVYHNDGQFLANRLGNAQKVLKRSFEGNFFGKVTEANRQIDGALFGAAAGSGVDLTSVSVQNLLARSTSYIAEGAGQRSNMCAVINHDVASFIVSSNVALGFKNADKVLENGLIGSSLGVDFYVSDFLTHERTYTFAGRAADAETFNFLKDVDGNAVGFKLIANGGALGAAGDMIKGADLAADLVVMAAALNNPGTTTATYQAQTSKKKLAALKGITATATGTTLTIKYKFGKWFTDTIGDLTNVTAGTILCYNYFGIKGGIDMETPFGIRSFIREESQRSDVNYLTESISGYAVTTRNKNMFSPMLTQSLW